MPKIFCVFFGLLLINDSVFAQTAEHKEADVVLRDLVQTPHHNLLTLSDPQQFAYVKATLDCAGLTAQARPALHAQLENARASEATQADAPQWTNLAALNAASDASPVVVPINIVENLNPVSAGSEDYTSTTLSTFNATEDDLVSVNVSVYLADANGEKIGDCASGSWMKSSASTDNNVTVTATGTAPNSTDAVFTRGVYTANYESGAVSTGQFYAEYTPGASNNGIRLTNDAPADLNDDSLIKVCTYRSETDCDYCYKWGSTSNCKVIIPEQTGEPNATNHSFIAFPIGGAIELPDGQTVTYGGDGKTPDSGQISILISDKASGGCAFNFSASDFFSSNLSNQTAQGFSWAIDPADWGVANGCPSSGADGFYSFTLGFASSTGSVIGYIGNGTGSGAQVSLETPPIRLVYGCLRDGTVIQLADGSPVEIQDVEVGKSIRSLNADGEPSEMVVEDILHGLPETLYLVQLDSGHEVGMTRGHGVTLADDDRKILAAEQLRIGHRLLTEDGAARITKITITENTETLVWNLRLKSAPDADEKDLQFIADGVLVGGARLQELAEAGVSETAHTPFAYLPEVWHQDFLNWQSEKRAASSN